MQNSTYETAIIHQVRLYEKLSLYLGKQGINLKSWIKHIDVFFQLQSNPNNKKVFIIMLILLEKLTNNKLIFLMDRNTLSRKRVIKIGCKIRIRASHIDNFMHLCVTSSLPKIINSQEILYIFTQKNEISYKLRKILFHSVFGSDSDFDLFYDYFDNALYNITISIRTMFKHMYINRLIVANYGFNNYI